MSAPDVPKVCPKCKRKDLTSFSKCRFCSTPYDAKIEAAPSVLGPGFFLALGFVGLLAVGGYFLNVRVQADRAEQKLPLSEQIRRAHRPRVIEFYADWCGTCQRYGPIVEACRSKFEGKIDVVRLNVDDSANRSMRETYKATTIPKTCLFNSDGDEMFEFVGGRTRPELEGLMQQLLH